MLNANDDIRAFSPLIPSVFLRLSRYKQFENKEYEIIVEPEVFLCFDREYNGYIIKRNGDLIKVEGEEKLQDLVTVDVYIKHIITSELKHIGNIQTSFTEIAGTCLQNSRKMKLRDFMDADEEAKNKWENVLSLDLINELWL